MFSKQSNKGYTCSLDGIKQKTIAYGEKTLMVEFQLEKDHTLPLHKHPYEQTGYLVTGNIELTIGEEKYNCKPGDSWCIPVNVEHGAHIIEDSIAVEVFSPPREDYLPK